MRVHPSIDALFAGNLKQVFLYITDRCALECEQCLYKTTLADRELPEEVASWFLEWAFSHGARKLTLIGGEPTMYGFRDRNEPLFRLIEGACEMGYQYVRLDTNGLFSQRLINDHRFQMLSNLAFSLDGHQASIHEPLRGAGTFEKTLSRLRQAVSKGMYTSVTTCVHPGNIDQTQEMIELCLSEFVRELNFHPLFLMGIPRDSFSGKAHISPHAWIEVFEALMKQKRILGSRLHIRAPRRFIPTTEYTSNTEAYNYCPTRMGERILVHPDGDIRICALCIGSPIRVARWEDGAIVPEVAFSEVSESRLARKPCMSQTRNFGELTPICISFKEFQNEFVWKTSEFDSRYGTTAEGDRDEAENLASGVQSVEAIT